MKKSEQLNNKVVKLEAELKEARKKVKIEERKEKKEQERKEYFKRVQFSLDFVEKAKELHITSNGQNISVFDYIKRNM